MAFSTYVLLGMVVVSLLQQGRHLAAAQTCDGFDACRCTMSDGSGTVDISSLGNRNGTPRFKDIYDSVGIPYYYNPCFSFSMEACKDVAVCKRDSSGAAVSLGTQGSAVWSYSVYYAALEYTSLDTKTHITMFCEENYETPQLDVIGEIGGVVAMTLWSKCGCPGKCERVDPIIPRSTEELTPGSIALIVFFCLLFVYLTVGTLIQFSRNHVLGKEMLPNYTFWSMLPGLIKDGFRFTWDCMCRRGLGGKISKVDYDQI